MSNSTELPPCILNAWRENEDELKHWLLCQLTSPELAADSLHDIFIKALLQGKTFCHINNPRAWLFQVARNYLIDTYRKDKKIVSLPDDIAIIDDDAVAVVDELTQCLPRVLSELNPDDGNIIRRCDIDGMSLQDYAEANQLTLTATKSRIQRARKRLRKNLIQNCKVIIDEHGAVCCFTPRK